MEDKAISLLWKIVQSLPSESWMEDHSFIDVDAVREAKKLLEGSRSAMPDERTAKLAASAEDLLEACKLACATLTNGLPGDVPARPYLKPDEQRAYDALRSAIQKAEGKS